jgi:hypothetical protein
MGPTQERLYDFFSLMLTPRHTELGTTPVASKDRH